MTDQKDNYVVLSQHLAHQMLSAFFVDTDVMHERVQTITDSEILDNSYSKDLVEKTESLVKVEKTFMVENNGERCILHYVSKTDGSICYVIETFNPVILAVNLTPNNPHSWVLYEERK